MVDPSGRALVIAVLGTYKHALRRTAEMEAAADMLTDLGVPPLIAEASRAVHERLTVPVQTPGRSTSRPSA